MTISGSSPALPLSAPMPGQTGAAQQSTAGPSRSPTKSASPHVELSPRKKAAIDKANKIYEANVTFTLRRATTTNRNADTDPIFQESIARYGTLRDRTIRQIVQPPQVPADNEPKLRVVGFKIDPQP